MAYMWLCNFLYKETFKILYMCVCIMRIYACVLAYMCAYFVRIGECVLLCIGGCAFLTYKPVCKNKKKDSMEMSVNHAAFLPGYFYPY